MCDNAQLGERHAHITAHEIFSKQIVQLQNVSTYHSSPANNGHL